MRCEKFLTHGQYGTVGYEIQTDPGIEKSVGGVGMALHPAVGLDNPRVGQNVDSKKDQTQEEAGEAPADITLSLFDIIH